MQSLRTQLEEDLDNVFFNLNEFAELHTIGGARDLKAAPQIECSVICSYNSGLANVDSARGGITAAYDLIFSIRKCEWTEKFGALPKIREELLFDNKSYLIEAVNDDMGLLEVALSAKGRGLY